VAALVKAEAGGTAAQGGAAQVMALVGRGREAFTAMAPQKRTRLIVCVMVIAAACAAVAWWGSRTVWKTLYSGMEGSDVQQVETELAAAGIEYQTTPDGLGVQVPSDLLDKARMQVAAKGMPQSGRMGFELFDKPNWVGSEFDEKVNYQRALEGELERTIETIGWVRSARVHLVLPKDSLFTSEQQPAKASVVLKLKGAAVRPEEVDSIRNLVAGAVEGLTPDQVTLVDADGKVNLNSPGATQAASDEEQALQHNLVTMLEPLAGRDNVRATVDIVYDQSSVDRTDEVVDPSEVVALTTQKSDQVMGATTQTKTGGVPGTVSNTPGLAQKGTAVAAAQAAAQATAKSDLSVYPNAAPQNGQMEHEESSTYAVSKHLTHEADGPGRILRITAAVLVNDRAVPGVMKDGQSTVWRPRTAEEMQRLQALAQAAVGFDAKRGDQVVLENISFADNVPVAAPTGMSKVSDEVQNLLQEQPDLLRTLGAGLMAVLLVLFVVRPVAKQAVVLLKEPRALGAGISGVGHALPVVAHGALAGASGEDAADVSMGSGARRGSMTLDNAGVLEHVATHIRTAPIQSTRLLEAWISDRGER
jgi:flagellar M-ring protein FliF